MKKIMILLVWFALAGCPPADTEVPENDNQTEICSDCTSKSGACSHHGGVDCSAGADSDGSVICSDGWRDSSVSYSCN